MPDLTIWIPCYDDLTHLEAALDSTIPYGDRVAVYVVDGRYATFPGETALTPGAEDLCAGYPHVTYTHPPRVPIDADDATKFRIHNHYDVPLNYLRLPQHEQATWVNYELLPQDEWVLRMDTDERIRSIDWDALAALDEQQKYVPTVWQTDGTQLTYPVRLYQPRYWSFWIDDVLFWREFYPRSSPVEELFDAHVHSSHRATSYGGVTEVIHLDNHGQERPAPYRERRAEQLEAMGSVLAARAVRDGKQPSMVDLQEYLDEDETVEDLQEARL